MGDNDLAAFFAKKKDKKKKKTGVINIDDIRERLERKAKRNEMDEIEDEEDGGLVKLSNKGTSHQQMDGGGEGEDSEWIVDFSKPSFAGLNIREMTEQDEESEDDSRASKEPVKTWNSANGTDKEVQKENVVAPPKVGPSVYRPKQMRAEAITLNNEMAFPSLANATEMEKHIKKEEEERKKEEQARKKQEEHRQEEEQRRRERFANRPQNTMSPSTDRTPRPAQEEKSENDDNWRMGAKANAPASPRRNMFRSGGDEPERTTVRPTGTAGLEPVQQQPPPPRGESDEAGTWRRPNKPAAVPIPVSPKQSTEAEKSETTAGKPVKEKYVPPALRNRQ